MTSEPPLTPLPIAGQPSSPVRHETVLPDEPADRLTALQTALAAPEPAVAVRAVVARWPTFLDAWARLAQLAWAAGDPVVAYACARTGYHRGLDRLRREGWGGTGLVRWSVTGNRGFLRALHLLMVSAATLGELDEAERCRQFLLDLDPDDGLHAAEVPVDPGPAWRPAQLP